MPAYRSLGDLRSELRARLGFSAAGAAAGVNQETLNSFLREAQNVLYWTHEWARLRRYETKTVGVNQYLIDYPATANPERIIALSLLQNGIWLPPMKKGISPQLYTYQDNTAPPNRWEPYEQIELWPKADQQYSLRIFFIKALDRFTQDGDAATIDDSLIFTVALADAKAHYRQPDAAEYKTRAETLLNSLRAKSWGKSTFSPYDYSEEEVMAKPRVV